MDTEFTDAGIDPVPTPTDVVYEIRSYESIAKVADNEVGPWISEPAGCRRTISSKKRSKRAVRKKAAKKARRRNRGK